MGEEKKIHPVPPTGSQNQKQLTNITSSSQQQQQPPAIPVMHSLNPPKKTNTCSFCKCICYTITILVFIVIIIAAVIGILYLAFQPKLPNYSINSLRISDLRLNVDLSLYAKFDVKITARNPNDKIGIYYEKGGKLSIWYTKTKLCEGALPVFYQGHRNTTKLDVVLTGQSQYGQTLMNALQEQQQTGRIPLDLKVDAPVAIKLGKLKLNKVRVLGRCLLEVNSLTTNDLITIKATNCAFKLKP